MCFFCIYLLAKPQIKLGKSGTRTTYLVLKNALLLRSKHFSLTMHHLNKFSDLLNRNQPYKRVSGTLQRRILLVIRICLFLPNQMIRFCTPQPLRGVAVCHK